MTHPGLPEIWAWSGMLFMLLFSIWYCFGKTQASGVYQWFSIVRMPYIGGLFKKLQHPTLLIALRTVVALVFILVISAGLIGNQIPERNIATTLTWTIWWSGVVIAVFFVGSAWCAICPWDTLASWIVKQKLMFRSKKPYSLEYKVPAYLRNLSIATLLFILMTWLELGYGITLSPYATAMMALTFVTLAVVSMLIFERKAFCQYFCPVGRTIGVYSELSMSTLRPIDNDVCSNCKTLECYHGNDQVEACPTHQVMGRMQQNSYCISCGQCVISCPHKNVNWALRSPETELAKGAREGTSESVFLLVILALTLFHGITMLPGWEALLNGVAAALNDSGRLLLSFSVLMLVCILVVLSVFIFASWVSAKLIFLKTNSLKNKSEFRKVSRKTFANLGFATLPVTFAYHVAHNLTHLFSESRGFGQVLMNPFGFGVTALSMGEKNMRHVPIINQSLIYMLQLGLIVLAFVIAIRVAHKRIRNVFSPQAGDKGIALSVIVPQTLYLLLISGFCLWLLAQPMSMRMSGM